MATTYEQIEDSLAAWIDAQRMFFVGTAPSGEDGHVNISPKGYPGTFRVLGPNRVAYLDAIGSGAETLAHVKQNGRIVVMFCAFDGPPRIVRLHGQGSLAQIGSPEFDELVPVFDSAAIEAAGLTPVLRSVVTVDVSRVTISCGFGVPLMEFEGWRPQLGAWASSRVAKLGPDAMNEYMREKNLVAIDGLPAIDAALLPDRSA